MGKHWQRVPRDVGGASSLETSRLRSGRALSHLICLKMSLLLAGHLVQMTCKGPCQAKPGEDSAGFACEKQRDWTLLEGAHEKTPPWRCCFPCSRLASTCSSSWADQRRSSSGSRLHSRKSRSRADRRLGSCSCGVPFCRIRQRACAESKHF